MPARLPALVPREHGASMELLFALLTAFSLARPSASAVALAASAVLVFVAHESFMVLIGRRGARRRSAQRAEAWRTMVVLALVSLVFLALAAYGMNGFALSTLAIPLALAAPAVVLALRGEERSMIAELFVVAALTSVCIPVALASDAPLFGVLEAAAIWLVCFTVGTLAARGVLYRAKDGGRGLRIAIGAGSFALALSTTLAVLGWLPILHALALVPSALVAIVVGMRPPSPKMMMRLGLGLTAASVASYALLVA